MGKVLYITRTALGAMGEAAVSKYVEIVRRHHDVEVAGTPTAEAVVTPPPDGVEFTALPSGPARKRQLALFDLIRRVRPDIIHMIQSPYCFNDLMGLRESFPDTKWVLDFRSPHVGSRDAPILKRFQAMHHHVDLLLTHSRLTLKTNVPRPWRAYHEVPPGVDTRDIPFSSKRDWPPRRFLYIGSLSKPRRIPALVEMFAAFAKTGSDYSDCTLDLIGGGNDGEAIGAAIAAHGLKDRVTIRDPLPQAELWAGMAKFDVGIAYVPMGEFELAPSLKSLEYAAAGLPILASATPGHVDFAQRHGLAFNLFDNQPDAFAAAASGLSGQDVAGQITANRTSSEALNWDAIITRDLLPLYDKLLGRTA